MRLRLLYDNRARAGYRADWGFACLVEAEEPVLFDTGAEPAVLLENMRAAGVQPSKVKKVVLSHDHWDHTGGLAEVIAQGGGAFVWGLPSFSNVLKSLVRSRATLHDGPEPLEVSPGVHTTGPVGSRIPEQGLWLETPRGVVLVTGCAHPGVDALLYSIRSDAPVHGVIGGFHGFRNLEALRDVPFIAPCHCSQFRKNFAERFPQSFCDAAAGDVFEF